MRAQRGAMNAAADAATKPSSPASAVTDVAAATPKAR